MRNGTEHTAKAVTEAEFRFCCGFDPCSYQLINFLLFFKKVLAKSKHLCYYILAPSERYAPVAQLDRVTGYEPVGQGFESLPAYQKPVFSTKGRVSSVLQYTKPRVQQRVAFFLIHRSPVQSLLRNLHRSHLHPFFRFSILRCGLADLQ